MHAQMLEIDNVAPNPGNLKMFVYEPEGLSTNAPLVVALHGCTQRAIDYAQETGWNNLADQYGFLVLYPEQQGENHQMNCFNWYQEQDINKGDGEALSIKVMVDYMKKNYSIDADRIYVSGLSAGGAMTVVMLATYPEVFKAGAVIAGLPYKATTTLEGALSAMRGEIDQSPDAWGSLVQEQNPDYEGEYPSLVLFHGTKDAVVNQQNMEELIEQWTHLHGIDMREVEEISNFDNNPYIRRRQYTNMYHIPKIVAYEAERMGHGIGVDPGDGPKKGGQTGKYAFDQNFFYTYWAAEFFELIK